MRSLVFAPAIRVALLTALAVAPAEAPFKRGPPRSRKRSRLTPRLRPIPFRTFGKRCSAPGGPSGSLGLS